MFFNVSCPCNTRAVTALQTFLSFVLLSRFSLFSITHIPCSSNHLHELNRYVMLVALHSLSLIPLVFFFKAPFLIMRPTNFDCVIRVLNMGVLTSSLGQYSLKLPQYWHFQNMAGFILLFSTSLITSALFFVCEESDQHSFHRCGPLLCNS